MNSFELTNFFKHRSGLIRLHAIKSFQVLLTLIVLFAIVKMVFSTVNDLTVLFEP